MSVRTNHIYWRYIRNLVESICELCGRGNVKSTPMAAGKATHSLQPRTKSNSHLCRDAIWHSKNKESLAGVCTLSHSAHYAAYSLNKYKTSIYMDYTTLYIERQKREWKFYSNLRNVGKHEVQEITERKRKQMFLLYIVRLWIKTQSAAWR